MGGGNYLTSWGALWSGFRSTEARINVDSPLATQEIGKALSGAIGTRLGLRSGLVIVCIGTDRSTGDALGPIVGTLLCDKGLPGVHVYGTLEQPVHATNLHDTLTMLSERHGSTLVVAVDACLGKSDSVGTISVGCGSLRPGAGVNKDLPAVGDVYITGVVNVGGFMEYFVLQNTRLYLVYRLAETIASGVEAAFHMWEKERRKA